MNRPSRESLSRTVARALALLVVVAGVAILLAWRFDIEALKSVLPNFVSMKPNTAMAFVLAGAALALPSTGRYGRVGLVCISIVLLLGVFTCIEYLFGFDIGLDQLLFLDSKPWQTSSPGRMAPTTAVNFVAFAAAYLLLDFASAKGRRPAQWLAILIFANAYLSVIGYLYNVAAFYRLADFTSVAVHTAVLFMLLALALLAARPEHGVMRLIVADSAGGILVRRLLPVALLLPPLIDWLQLRASSPGSFGFSVALIALMNVVALVVLAWWTANSVWRADLARHAAEAVVRTSEDRLHVALQAAGGGAWDWDLVDNVAWWSPEMYTLWGVPAGTVMHLENSVAAITAEDRDVVQRSMDAAIANRTNYQTEFRICHPQHGERWMASRGQVGYDDNGRPTRVVGITLDITEQKRVELALRRANEALERSNIELQRFAHVASHDLQTPMRSITSFVELLQRKYGDRLDAEGRDWIDRIVQSVGDLRALVRDLLQYSRVDSQVRPFAETNMVRVYDRTLVLLDSAVRESGATVTRNALPTISGDATLLAELLMNLIGNAIKYRGVDSPRIHIDCTEQPDEWLFSVRDNGIGIAAHHRQRVFEIFERLHTQQQYPGTGIGLAICRRVVQRHGGRIWVESELGTGSAFFFTIPKSPATLE